MSAFVRLRRAVNPRRSFGARLLFGFSLAFLVPVALFVILLSARLADLQQQSAQRLAEVQRGQAPEQVRRDAAHDLAPKSYGELRKYLVLTFLYLIAAMLAALLLITRHFTSSPTTWAATRPGTRLSWTG